MRIELYRTLSERERIQKSLTSKIELDGNLKDTSSVVSPSILIKAANPTLYNYAHIPDFGRYYYIKDTVSVRTGLWEIMLEVDVLMTYSPQILNLSVILDKSENKGYDYYLADPDWKTKVKDMTDIVNFPSGLNSNGEFILITAGG
jgi:hypothetical protein